MSIEPTQAQQAICDRFGAQPSAFPAEAMVGIGPMDGAPLNGLRHPPESGTSGWFIWAGGDIDEANGSFFQPMHFAHLRTSHPAVVPYLALPPGWRFQIAPDHEDVWFDESLLTI
jgi:hypothetical protein